jgi:hypothetical protein|tara:strand:+ start:143 stop:1018 length:876 start_codon:yes stop_codon:yes gene_type:complete
MWNPLLMHPLDKYETEEINVPLGKGLKIVGSGGSSIIQELFSEENAVETYEWLGEYWYFSIEKNYTLVDYTQIFDGIRIRHSFSELIRSGKNNQPLSWHHDGDHEFPLITVLYKHGQDRSYRNSANTILAPSRTMLNYISDPIHEVEQKARIEIPDHESIKYVRKAWLNRAESIRQGSYPPERIWDGLGSTMKNFGNIPHRFLEDFPHPEWIVNSENCNKMLKDMCENGKDFIFPQTYKQESALVFVDNFMVHARVCNNFKKDSLHVFRFKPDSDVWKELGLPLHMYHDAA